MGFTHAPGADGHIGKGKARGGAAAPKGPAASICSISAGVTAEGIKQAVDAADRAGLRCRPLAGPATRQGVPWPACIWSCATVRPAAILWPPPFSNQPLCGQPLHRGTQIDAGDRPGRALADHRPPARSPRRGDGWPLSAARRRCRPRRDASLRPPPRPADHPARAPRPGPSASSRTPFVDLAPLGVQLVQPCGHRGGLGRVVGGQQPRAKIGLTDAPAGVDAWSKEEAQRIGGGGLIHPRDIGQRAQARRVRAAP